MNDNTGHGHVWERPDGVKARCGGPSICKECALDAARYGSNPAPTFEKPEPPKNPPKVAVTHCVGGTHDPSMNLRFVIRKIDGKEVRVLQQMYIPRHWQQNLDREPFWQDIQCFNEAELSG